MSAVKETATKKQTTEGVAQGMMVQDKAVFFVPQPRLAPKLRLFYFPFAGGSAQSYQQWQRSFHSDLELVFVQLKGRGSRINEAPHQSMQDVVQELISQWTDLSQCPYVIFGHSMGALIGYALCCRLQQLNLALPLHLFASACRAPHLPYLNPNRHNLAQEDFIRALEQLKGTPNEVLRNKELMELFEPMLRADFRIAETYQAEPVKMPFSLSVLYGEQDSSVSERQLVAWSELTDQQCWLRSYPGEHFYLNQHQHQLVDYMQSVMAQWLNDEAAGV